jgi:ADP-ribose pyrophosphatase YjhB (NUDIX family)
MLAPAPSLPNPSLLKVPVGSPERLIVPDNLVPWSTDFPDYHPPIFTNPTILRRPAIDKYADPDNAIDVPNRSRLPTNKLITDERGRLLCPLGRTGLGGRLSNGKWGANPCVDVAYVAFNQNANPYVILINSSVKPWMFPGGHLDISPMQTLEDALQSESFEEAAARELAEEVHCNDKPLEMLGKVSCLESCYVVPTRFTTDNSWRETSFFVCISHKNLEEHSLIKGMDDAEDAKWFPIDEKLPGVVYSGHSYLATLLLKYCGVISPQILH